MSVSVVCAFGEGVNIGWTGSNKGRRVGDVMGISDGDRLDGDSLGLALATELGDSEGVRVGA